MAAQRLSGLAHREDRKGPARPVAQPPPLVFPEQEPRVGGGTSGGPGVEGSGRVEAEAGIGREERVERRVGGDEVCDPCAEGLEAPVLCDGWVEKGIEAHRPGDHQRGHAEDQPVPLRLPGGACESQGHGGRCQREQNER